MMIHIIPATISTVSTISLILAAIILRATPGDILPEAHPTQII